MVEMFEESVNGIEVIHAIPAGARDKPLPTIFFYHGFLSSKSVYAYFGYQLAQAGFRVILPDAPQHGGRFNGDEAQRWAQFWQILQHNIEELPALKDHYQQQGLIADQRIGVAGASMGGMTTLGALTQYPWIRAAASLMGSGYFDRLSASLFPPRIDGQVATGEQRAALLAPLLAYQAEQHLASLSQRPLLLWHGGADDVVPAADSEQLAQALRQQNRDQALTAITEAGVSHRITPLALEATADFFSQNL